MAPRLLIPKLSIIIPTYKRYVDLDACICSILKQDEHYEIIIVSDGYDINTDEIMLKICAKYKSKSKQIIYLKQKNQGPATARNNGLKRAKGEIITFLDDDSVVSENWVKDIISAHKQHPGILAIAGSIIPYDKSLISEFSQSLEARAGTRDNSYFYPSLINNNSYKRGVFNTDTNNTTIKFNPAFKHAAGEDVEFNYQLHLRGIKTLFIQKISIKHRYRDKFGPFLRQQFGFGKERLKHMRITDDYPFDKSNKFLYILKRIATPIVDPWLRFICAFRLHRRHKIMYIFLGYFQQASYWSGFMYSIFRSMFGLNI